MSDISTHLNVFVHINTVHLQIHGKVMLSVKALAILASF